MNEVVINFLNKVLYVLSFPPPSSPSHPSLPLTSPSFQVPYHSDKFLQEAWLVQQLKEREKMVREEGRWRREDVGQHTGELPMQTGGASEQVGTVHSMSMSCTLCPPYVLQECSESVRVLQHAWEGVERCRGWLSPGLLEEVHRLGQGMLDFASQGGTLALYGHR